jgi:osmotically-inducible protein OsmY
MRSTNNKALRDAVAKALESEVKIDPTHVGITAAHGAVTLVGFVRSPAQKARAVRAAARVPGVIAVADELEVRPPGSPARADAELAEDLARWREWAMVPASVTIFVRNGRVTLRGDVDSDAQRREAERVAARIRGVRKVTNHIVVRPQPAPDPKEIQSRADDAIRSGADSDARSIRATVEGGTVHLTGKVRTDAESRAAERAAASAPGVTAIVNEIVVAP